MLHDLRDAVRALRATPLVSAAAILSLALGIGANTAIFSLIDATLFRPLPVHDPDRLILLTENGEDGAAFVRQQVWQQIRRRQLLDNGFAWTWTRFDTASGGEKQLVNGALLSGGAFDALGVKPELGRLLREVDDRERGGSDGLVTVISHDFWTRRYRGDASVIGRAIAIDRVSYTIVGVMPQEFRGLDVGLAVDVVIPLSAGGSGGYVSVISRLRANDSAAAVTARLRVAQPSIRDATNPYSVSPYREEYLRAPLGVRVAPNGSSFLQRRYARPFTVLQFVVAAVLLIACANIATLIVARTIARRHEIGIRLALGASRIRVVRQLVVESLLLSTTATVVGVLVARWTAPLALTRLSTQAFTVTADLSPDWRSGSFTVGVSLIASLVFGGISALFAARADAFEAVRARVGNASAFRFGQAMIVAQIALSLTLVVATGLFVRTFIALATAPLGFDASRVLVASVDASRSGVLPANRRALFERIEQAVAQLPNADRAALSLAMPGGNMAYGHWFELADGTKLPQGGNGVFDNRVSADWFAALGINLVSGRPFDVRDRAGAPAAAIVNQTFVRRFLAGRVVGQTIAVHMDGPSSPLESLTIVGVVEDSMYRFVKETPPPTVFLSLAQMTQPASASINLSVRAKGAQTSSLSRSVVDAIGGIDSDVSLTFRLLTEQVSAQYTQERLVATVAAMFGGLALVLASLGLYGVTAYAVAARRVEIGIRMALGAAPRRVMMMVLARVAVLFGIGATIGAIGSVWIARFVGSLLYGVRPGDPSTTLTSILVLILVAAAAAWFPARRAARLDPAVVLRDT